MAWEAAEKKARKRAARAEQVAAREKKWIATYEAGMAKCLGDESYKLPGGRA